MKRLFLSILLIATSGAAFAASDALCVNHWCVSSDVFQVMYQSMKVNQPNLTQADLRKELVDARLLAQYARKQGFTLPETPYHVGFSNETRIDQERYSLLYRQHVTAFMASTKQDLGKKGLEIYLLDPIRVTGIDIDAALKPANLRRVGMTPVQLDAAKTIQLARFQFPKSEPETITLEEIYKRQNVQGRLALQKPDSADFLRHAVEQQIKAAYFFWWLTHNTTLTTDDITRIGQVLRDRLLTNRWMQKHGIVEVMHYEAGPSFEAKVDAVTQQQVAAWYRHHKADFRVTNRVRAMHIACDSKLDCSAARNALLAGKDVAEVVAKYADKTHQQKTDLGNLTRQKDGMQWLTSLAMLQEPGKYSLPVRAPDGHWEVVWVSEKEVGFLPADSSAVRYEASRAIAHAELLQEHKALMQQLRQHATITMMK